MSQEVTIKSFSNIPNNDTPTYHSDFCPLMDPVIISPDGVLKILNGPKLSSATGIDEINSKFLKATTEYSFLILARIFQQWIDT